MLTIEHQKILFTKEKRKYGVLFHNRKTAPDGKIAKRCVQCLQFVPSIPLSKVAYKRVSGEATREN